MVGCGKARLGILSTMRETTHICGSGMLFDELGDEHRLELLHTLVDSTADAILAHDPSGKIVFYNHSACELLGMDSAQMASIPPFGWIGPESQRGSTQRLETILHEGQLTFPSSLRRGNGEIVPTEVSARRVDTELGPLIVAVIRDVSAREEAERRLLHLAYHDALTGLANRRSLDDRMRFGTAEARRHGDLLVLAYIDLDRFKPINDRFGHDAGDLVLIEVGRRLSVSVREQDLVARIGGDEFVVLLQRVESCDEIEPIAERLLEAIREPIDACGVDCKVDASIGFSVFDPDLDDARSLLVKADVAMYEAKRDPAHPWLMYDKERMGAIEPGQGPGANRHA